MLLSVSADNEPRTIREMKKITFAHGVKSPVGGF